MLSVPVARMPTAPVYSYARRIFLDTELHTEDELHIEECGLQKQKKNPRAQVYSPLCSMTIPSL